MVYFNYIIILSEIKIIIRKHRKYANLLFNSFYHIPNKSNPAEVKPFFVNFFINLAKGLAYFKLSFNTHSLSVPRMLHTFRRKKIELSLSATIAVKSFPTKSTTTTMHRLFLSFITSPHNSKLSGLRRKSITLIIKYPFSLCRGEM